MRAQDESPVKVTRRGLAITALAWAQSQSLEPPANSWAGRIEIVGDIVNGDPEIWDVVSNPTKDL
jgi:hypothetical protein